MFSLGVAGPGPQAGPRSVFAAEPGEPDQSALLSEAVVGAPASSRGCGVAHMGGGQAGILGGGPEREQCEVVGGHAGAIQTDDDDEGAGLTDEEFGRVQAGLRQFLSAAGVVGFAEVGGPSVGE